MNSIILSCIPKYIQAAIDKKTHHKGVLKYKAITEYPFIQISHPKYFKMLVIDIDNRDEYPTFESIFEKCQQENIPIPTNVVETNKGWHIHWFFETTLWKNSKYDMAFKRKFLSKMNDIFGGDKNFSNFIIRNPNFHNHIFTGVMYDKHKLKDFVSVTTQDLQRTEKINKNNPFYDFEHTFEGNRNQTLYAYLRDYCFVNFKSMQNVSCLISEALRVNRRFPNPLPENEVVDVAKSVYKWVCENYNENYDKSVYTKRNKLVAKIKKEKTKNKMLLNLKNKIENETISVIGIIREIYSKSWLSKVLGVDRKTFRKYYKLLLDFILNMLKYKNEFISKFKEKIEEIVEHIYQIFVKLYILLGIPIQKIKFNF